MSAAAPLPLGHAPASSRSFEALPATREPTLVRAQPSPLRVFEHRS